MTDSMPITTATTVATSTPMIVVDHVTKHYGQGHARVTAVNDVSFEIPRGRLVALIGRSGSGKTTLLNCIGGLDRPSEGRIIVDDDAVTHMNERRRTALRRDTVAFVFQTFGLVPMLSAAENVGLPMRLKNVRTSIRDRKVKELLDLVGLAKHMDQRPSELSGGQQQRVAIARALANEPRLLIADEPTGQLDADTGNAVMALLANVIREQGMTAIISTHDQTLIDLADLEVRLADGRLVASDGSEMGTRATGTEWGKI